MAAALDLAEFRLLRALKAAPAGPAFTQLWNAHAGAAWSVLRALAERDAEAIGWMASFRLELAERVSRFRVDEGVAPQVGAALYAHAHPGFAQAGPLPDTPLPPDEAGVRQLPRATRLAYLVDLFFDWTPPDPTVRQAYRLLEPAGDTDARLLVHAALLRNPPAEALILPPGAAPPPARPRRRHRSAIVLGVAVGAALVAWWMQPPDPAQLHQDVLSARGGVVVEAEPAALVERLRAAGLSAPLAECPDLRWRGLRLVGGRAVGGGAVLLYEGEGGAWTLQHRSGGVLVGTREADGIYAGEAEGLAFASWRDGAGAWTLTARAPRARVLTTARDIVADRARTP